MGPGFFIFFHRNEATDSGVFDSYDYQKSKYVNEELEAFLADTETEQKVPDNLKEQVKDTINAMALAQTEKATEQEIVEISEDYGIGLIEALQEYAKRRREEMYRRMMDDEEFLLILLLSL